MNYIMLREQNEINYKFKVDFSKIILKHLMVNNVFNNG